MINANRNKLTHTKAYRMTMGSVLSQSYMDFCCRIFRDWITMARQDLLEGRTVVLPGKQAQIRIEKSVTVRLPRRTKNSTNKLCRPGYSYRIVFVPIPGRNITNYEFIPSSKFRKMLNQVLTTTDQEYPFYD